MTEPIEVDALIIGAGPIGLFQVFELGLQDIAAHVIDTLPHPGGQCIELYADKPIYDIPAVAMYTGLQLIDNLLKQAAPFKPVFHLGQEVSVVIHRDDGRFDVQTSKATRFVAKTIFIAGGVGSFQRRELKVQGLQEYEGREVFYTVPDDAVLAGRHVIIAGSDDIALEHANRLGTLGGDSKPLSITLIHRRDVLQAEAATLAAFKALRESGAVAFVAGAINGGHADDEHLSSVEVALSEGGSQTLPVGALLVLLGVSPKLGPIADWGVALERRQVVVDTEKFETNIPGIFAVGDVNSYPGKRKLIVSGFHEATLAAFAAAPYVHPDKRVLLQYTTTSTKLHEALGVANSGTNAKHGE